MIFYLFQVRQFIEMISGADTLELTAANNTGAAAAPAANNITADDPTHMDTDAETDNMLNNGNTIRFDLCKYTALVIE